MSTDKEKKKSEKIKQASETDSAITYILEVLDTDLKITMINMLSAVLEKVYNMNTCVI